jgi:hypothetical protein
MTSRSWIGRDHWISLRIQCDPMIRGCESSMKAVVISLDRKISLFTNNYFDGARDAMEGYI